MPIKLYDNFNDNSIDATKWTTSGTIAETGAKLVLGTTGGNDAAEAETTRFARYGWLTEWDVQNRGAEGQDGAYVEIRNAGNTKSIRVTHAGGVDKVDISTNGYGGGSATGIAYGSTVKFLQVGADIKVYIDGNVELTLSNQVMALSTFHAKTFDISGADQKVALDNVQYVANDGGSFLLFLD